MISVSISKQSDGITMKYRIGQSQDMRVYTIVDIGIMRTIGVFDFQRPVMKMENGGKIAQAFLTITDEKITHLKFSLLNK